MRQPQITLRKGPLEAAQTFEQSPRFALWCKCCSGRHAKQGINLAAKTSLPSGNPVGALGAGTADRPNHHDHASKIAVSYTVSRPMADSATFGLSSRRASPITWPSSTEQSREFGTQLLPRSHPLSGFFLSGPDNVD